MFTHQFIDERVASVCVELADIGRHFIISSIRMLQTDFTKDAELKHSLWQKLKDLVERIPSKECLFVPMDASAQTGQRIDGCGDDESRVIGAYGRDVRNDIVKRFSVVRHQFLVVSSYHQQAFQHAQKGGISHTHYGISRNDRERTS